MLDPRHFDCIYWSVVLIPLNLISALPVIDKPILETNANDGDNATLFCSATGYPSVEFRWYKVGSQLLAKECATEYWLTAKPAQEKCG